MLYIQHRLCNPNDNGSTNLTGVRMTYEYYFQLFKQQQPYFL